MAAEERKERQEEMDAPFPKNIKQMGSVDPQCRIYMEDYVYTFLNQLSRQEKGEHLAVLVGQTAQDAQTECLYISGAIEGRDTAQDPDGQVFTEASWAYIHRQMALYFSGLSIVGWVHIQPDFGVYLMGKDEAFHKECFPEKEHVLFLMDPVEKTDGFYVYEQEGRGLRPARGYFLYYEKNEAMQNYMIEHSNQKARPVPPEEEVAPPRPSLAKLFGLGGRKNQDTDPIDRIDAAGRIRAVLHRKEEAQTVAKLRYRALTAVCGSLCAACLLMALHLVQNNGRMELLEGQMAAMEESYAQMSQTIHETAQTVFAPQPSNAKESEQTDDAKGESAAQLPKQEQPDAVAAQIYEVKPGDTLWDISRTVYGSEAYVPEIMAANHLEDENWIVEGQRLLLPARP